MPARDDAWWIYGFVAGDHPLPDGLVGVGGGVPVAIEAGRLAAVASAVPLDEYGEEPLREHLDDLDWLERMARTHETVLERMLRAGEVVPARACTIYSSEAEVTTMLEERSALLEETLARLEGRAEWGVKAMLDRTGLEAPIVDALALDAAGRSPGAADRATKPLAARLRDESERAVADVVRDVHSRLEGCATAARVLPAQKGELSQVAGEMVLNAAYLVDEDRAEAFAALVNELGLRYDAVGLALELTGPWPAYNFVGAPR